MHKGMFRTGETVISSIRNGRDDGPRPGCDQDDRRHFRISLPTLTCLACHSQNVSRADPELAWLIGPPQTGPTGPVSRVSQTSYSNPEDEEP